MPTVIIVDLNNFALEKPITILQGDKKTEYKGRIENIPEFVTHYASKVDVEKVYLYGAKSYAEPIAEKILTFAKQQYNNNDLKVEVVTR